MVSRVSRFTIIIIIIMMMLETHKTTLMASYKVIPHVGSKTGTLKV